MQYVQDGVKPINVYFKGPFGVSLDCDAPEFMDCANHLEYLLKDNSVRQSRPGIIFLANIVSLATKPLANRLMETIKPQAPTATSDYRYEKASKEFPATYMAYVGINFCLLLLGLFIWIRLFGNNPSAIALPISLLVFLNPVVKMFFFIPHTQMFNILVPIATYWMTTESLKEDFFLKKIPIG